MIAIQLYTKPPISSFFCQLRRSVSLAVLGLGAEWHFFITRLLLASIPSWLTCFTGQCLMAPCDSGLAVLGELRGCLPSFAGSGSGMGAGDAGQGEVLAFMSHCIPSSSALAPALNCCWSLVPHWGEGGALRGSRL